MENELKVKKKKLGTYFFCIQKKVITLNAKHTHTERLVRFSGWIVCGRDDQELIVDC